MIVRFEMKIKSKKQEQKDRLILKSKKKLIEESPRCRICGIREGTDLMHILPKSTYPEYCTLEENHTLGCRACHIFFDDNLDFRRKQKRLYEQVKKFDELAANKYFRI